ncbi:aminodeoxychorismate lyase [Beutenbergia cavernae DSM 12333]|uniref:Endolytic murein transglycosylase n=1 Tax=Beutenbergia cavernae (strain ATCC BAA-8 / DSM 12333 / CCUG 43141 / JCM 11478 / NBRC 16432 / NCIMB 13614 / HKI 0122) TaxID=471853 RepID=C5C5T0_BEUC1|nr:endolytic transglycosylase MltG [Beutenbergia cavernae]ACQ80271.1 aminodeoxychorismate lyase [Beutenbergia cavernae DSM 12333]
MSDLFADEHVSDLERIEEIEIDHDESARRRSARRAARREAELRRRKRRRRTIASLVVMILTLGLLVAGGWFVVRPMLNDLGGDPTVTDFPGPGEDDVQVVVAEGASGAEIGQTLLDEGVVATVDAFVDAYNANANATQIQPGTYNLQTKMAAADAVRALLDPSARADSTITIPEAWTAAQIYERVANVLGVPLEDVQTAASDPASLGLPADINTNADVIDPLEGWLAPGTYSAEPGATPTDVLSQMAARQLTVLDEAGVAPEERLRVLTIASIAEREVANADYYGQVARVIENRLVEGNATGATTLGMDSTLSYALGLPANEIDHNQDHPYNTRVRPGLPPSPIATPRPEAIAAAVSPTEGDWLFFVTLDLCSGETEFTSSSAEFEDLAAQFRAWFDEYEANGSECG